MKSSFRFSPMTVTLCCSYNLFISLTTLPAMCINIASLLTCLLSASPYPSSMRWRVAVLSTVVPACRGTHHTKDRWLKSKWANEQIRPGIHPFQPSQGICTSLFWAASLARFLCSTSLPTSIWTHLACVHPLCSVNNLKSHAALCGWCMSPSALYPKEERWDAKADLGYTPCEAPGTKKCSINI